MEAQICFCRKCDWTGSDHFVYDRVARRALLDGLQPGDIVPAGACPRCGAPVYPEALMKGRVSSREWQWGQAGASDARWDVLLCRLGPGYGIQLQHPHGFGCEVSLEITHERPLVQVTTWNSPEHALEAEPIANIKVGEDHVLFTNTEDTSASVVADAERMRSALLTRTGWSDFKGWSDRPQ